jgi:hypothetical protein
MGIVQRSQDDLPARVAFCREVDPPLPGQTQRIDEPPQTGKRHRACHVSHRNHGGSAIGRRDREGLYRGEG